MKNASAQKLWDKFLESHPKFVVKALPTVGHFCDNVNDANICANLARKEIKRATSHSLLGLQLKKEPLPKIGDLHIVTDWKGEAKCLIRTTSVKMLPFFAIHAEHARLEGEGDKSLEYWRKVHWDYYTRELEPFNRQPRESMIVVFERFEKLF